MKKPAFISSIGRHSLNSLGKDLSFDEFVKIHNQIKNEGFNTSHFKNLSKNMSLTDMLMTNGLKIGTALLLKTLDSNDLKSIHPNKKLFFTQLNANNRFARSKVFNEVTVHYGRETSKRIRNYQNTPNIESQNKIIFDTEENLSNLKRKDLNLKSGFNQKNYSFIPSRFSLNRKKFSSLHKQAIEQAKRSKNNFKQIFSCSFYIKNQLKIFNNDQDFNANIEIFLLQIENRLSPAQVLNRSFKTKSSFQTSKVAGETGLFPEEKQLNVLPNLSDYTCSKDIINLKTTISSDIFMDSEFLKNNLKIVHKWRRTLTPGALFRLNITQHLGKGINLNQFIIESNKDENNIEGLDPINELCLLDNSLIVILNYGEKNCRLIDKKYQSPRNGYSTSNINFEFKTNYKFLGEGEFFERPCTYREKRKSESFESEIFKQINEDRPNKEFNINYEEIGSLEEQNFYLERSEKLETINGDSLDKLKSIYQSAKIDDIESLSEDDFIFSKNLTNATDEIDDDLEDIDLFEE